jgi:hypothetical protein
VPEVSAIRARNDSLRSTLHAGMAIIQGVLSATLTLGLLPACPLLGNDRENRRSSVAKVTWLCRGSLGVSRRLAVLVGALESLQFRVLCPGLLEDGNDRVSVFPEGEEILVAPACPFRISRQHIGPSELEPC